MNLHVRKTGPETLVVIGNQAQLRRLKTGEEYACRIWKPRSLAFHRKLFALVQFMFENQEEYQNFEHFREALKVEVGDVWELVIKRTGEIRWVTNTWSFERSQDEIEQVYENVVEYAMDRFTDGRSDAAELHREIAQFGH